MTQQPHVPEGSVIIAPADVYAEVVKLTQVVTQLVERDNADRKQNDQLASDVSDLKRDLEALKVKVYGIAAVFTAVGAAVGSAVSPLIR